MPDIQHIVNIFNDHIDTTTRSLEPLAGLLLDASDMMVQSLLNDNKIICCGNGESSSLAEQFCTYLLNRFDQERPSLPTLNLSGNSATLSAIARDSSFNEVFAKQLRAMGEEGDILLALTTSGNENNIVQAITTARSRGMAVIVCSGADGGGVAALLTPEDLELRVPSINEARIHEVHLLIINCLCEMIDHSLFNSEV